MLVDARLDGFPQEHIDEFRKLDARRQYGRRELFEYWLEQWKAEGQRPSSSGQWAAFLNPPRAVPFNWLSRESKQNPNWWPQHATWVTPGWPQQGTYTVSYPLTTTWIQPTPLTTGVTYTLIDATKGST
jgi:hypothetical protein